MRLDEAIRNAVERFRSEFEYSEVDVEGFDLKCEDIAGLIDQTLLKPEATLEDLRNFVEKSLDYPFCSLCVPLSYLTETKKLVEESGKDVKISTVVGFPHGNIPTRIKMEEAKYSLDHGADEIDMVINIGLLRSGSYDLVFEDIGSVVESSGNLKVKVIIETCYLTDEEKVIASIITKEAGADFVKTSTGFGKYGADLRDIEIIRFTVGENFGVKAAGGIRNLEYLLKCVKAGANRIGTSRGVEIVEEVEGCSRRKA